MRPMPSGIHIDFYGPLPRSEYILVILDAYSRFPIAEIVKSTADPSIIPKLDQIFALHGLPEEVVTDVGPPFDGNDITGCLMTLGIHFEPSTSL